MPGSNGRVTRLGESLLVNADCVQGALEHLADGCVDLIVTDPPYGIEGDKLHRHYNRRERFVVGKYVEVPARDYPRFTRAWITQAQRVLRPGGQLYVVSGYTNLYDVLAALRETSLYELNHIIWKYNFGVYTTRKYVSSHYHILYWAKPGPRRTFNLEARHALDESGAGGSANYRDREDVWIINREYKPGRAKNKNELPAALLRKVIAYSSNPGDLVCDFFLGGGSAAAVAIAMSRRFVGFEISSQTFTGSLGRLKAVVPGSLCEPPRRSRTPAKRGKAWNSAEESLLMKRFQGMREAGIPQGAIVTTLTNEFERGAWAIRKRLIALRDGAGSV